MTPLNVSDEVRALECGLGTTSLVARYQARGALRNLVEQFETTRDAVRRIQQFAESMDDKDEGFVWLKQVCREALGDSP